VYTLIAREVAAVWRRRWLAVGVAWIICLGGWFSVSRIPDQYESSARLYVDTDAILTPLLRGLAIDTSVLGQVEVLQRTMLSRPNLEKLVSETALKQSVSGPADLDRLVAGLANAIKIQPQTRDLFTITFRAADPQLSYDVVHTLVNSFIDTTIGSKRTDMASANQFLENQLESYQAQLRTAEQKRAAFRAKYVDLLPGEGDSGTSRLDEAENSVRVLQGQLLDALSKDAMMTKELASTPALVVSEPGTGPSGLSPLADAERRLQELRLRYTEQYPDVVAAKRLVATLRASGGGAASGTTGTPQRSLPNPVYEQLKVRVVENQSVVASLQRQVNDAMKERNRLQEIARGAPGLQAEYVNLNRDYDVLRKNYEELLARREGMRIASAAETGADKLKLQIVDPPQLPRFPVGPKRLLLLSGVLVAGLAGGVGSAFFLSTIESNFESVNDLRTLGWPVVGGISVLAAVDTVRHRILSILPVLMAVALLCILYGGLIYRILQRDAAA
jgi:polysaccharide chain length determinant protein (PEP-CTERM system associated)